MKKALLGILICILASSALLAGCGDDGDGGDTSRHVAVTFGGAGGYGGATGSSVQQTADGGFIICGWTRDEAMNTDWYLLKTDRNGTEQWHRTFGGDEYDESYCVRQTTDGGFIVCGHTSSFGADGPDVYLVKTDKKGTEQWHQTFGGDSMDYGYCVQQTADKGFIICGETYSTVGGDPDIYLIKTDQNGTEQWHQTFGGAGGDQALSVQETTDGGFIVCGRASLAGDEAGFYLLKTDRNGAEQWHMSRPGGAEGDYGTSVQQTTDGGFIICGYSLSAAAINMYLLKTDQNGTEQWHRIFGVAGPEYGWSVQQTTDEGFIICGDTYVAGSSDVYLVKTDKNGIEQWHRTFGGAEDDHGASVQQTSDGGFVICGSTLACVDTFPSGCVYLIITDAEGNID